VLLVMQNYWGTEETQQAPKAPKTDGWFEGVVTAYFISV
jgi:hypothetical protein